MNTFIPIPAIVPALITVAPYIVSAAGTLISTGLYLKTQEDIVKTDEHIAKAEELLGEKKEEIAKVRGDLENSHAALDKSMGYIDALMQEHEQQLESLSNHYKNNVQLLKNLNSKKNKTIGQMASERNSKNAELECKNIEINKKNDELKNKDKELVCLKEAYSEKIKDLEIDFKGNLATLTATYERQISSTRAELNSTNAKLAEIEEKHSAELASLREEHEEELANLKAYYEEKITSIEKAHHETEEKVSELTAQLVEHQATISGFATHQQASESFMNQFGDLLASLQLHAAQQSAPISSDSTSKSEMKSLQSSTLASDNTSSVPLNDKSFAANNVSAVV